VKKIVLLFVTLWAVGATGFLFAQEPSVTETQENHPMIFELKDRIKNQNERIDQGLNNNTLSVDQANACRAVLESVEKQMKGDYKTNGPKKLTREEYTALNSSLDVNSATIREEKQYFYYYDPYWNNYSYDYYYYDKTLNDYPVNGSPTPHVSAIEEVHPMIFELKERIKNQRARIDRGLIGKTLSEEQAKDCRDILKTVEKEMKSDCAANGSKKDMKLTRKEYAAFNTALDMNSSILNEKKQNFYYYDSYYDQHYY
jgi:ABC-type proline/glycine betaine transport system substrate-binding protein